MSARISPAHIQTTSASGVKRLVLQPKQAIAAAHAPKPLRTIKKPTAYFLVIAHSEKGALSQHARQAIAAAAILANSKTTVCVLVLGELNENLSDAGADEVMRLPALDFQLFQPDIELAAILNVIEALKPARIFMPDNTIGDGDLGRRLIAKTQLSAATQVAEITAKHVASPQLGGCALATKALPEIILLAANTVDLELPFSAKATPIAAPIAVPSIKLATSRYQDLGLQSSSAQDIALEEADFIVSAGNGVQNLATLNTLANALNASIGASRVVVDNGKLPRDKQIGATGKTVTASTYLAVGISGAVQHLQGIKDCRHVIAVNTDASAPIVKRADLTIIGDAQAIMQALIDEIAQAKANACA
jgi:electron transfer flavoprotein alpha subunit